jgi:hypothetical protein
MRLFESIDDDSGNNRKRKHECCSEEQSTDHDHDKRTHPSEKGPSQDCAVCLEPPGASGKVHIAKCKQTCFSRNVHAEISKHKNNVPTLPHALPHKLSLGDTNESQITMN